MEGRFRVAGACALAIATLAVGLGTIGIATATPAPLTGTLHVRTQMFRTTSKVQYALTLDSGEELTLHPRRTDTAGINAYAEKRVQISGARHGDDVTVTGVQPVAAKQQARAALTLPASGPRNVKLAVFMVNFTNNRTQQYTADQLRNEVFTGTKSTAKYWSESTGGQVTITGDVFGYYQLNMSSGDCTQMGAWMNAAKAMATARGVNLGAYTNFQMWIPWTDNCGWAGLGEIGGAQTWVEAPSFYPDLVWAWPAHELGHNLNIDHSSAWSCPAGTAPADPTTCPHDEYGDPYDVMGAVWANGGRLLTAVHRAELGNLKPLVVTGPGTYTLAPAEATNAAATQVIQMPRGDGTTLWLEFHRPYGTFDTFDISDPAVNGVTMHVTKPDDGGRYVPHLIDSSPGDGDMTNAPFGPGKSFTDPVSHLVVKVSAVTTTGATVVIAPPASPAGQAAVSNGVLNVTAGAGTNDNITVARNVSTGRYVVTSSNPITPGAGCVPLTSKQVQCSGVTSSVVKGGDGNDTLTINAGSQRTTISGGGGNDTLTSQGSGKAVMNGNAGNDTLIGGGGTDKLTGAGGNDTIYAKDGHAEVVNCKAGTDTVTVDASDTVKDCETVKF